MSARYEHLRACALGQHPRDGCAEGLGVVVRGGVGVWVREPVTHPASPSIPAATQRPSADPEVVGTLTDMLLHHLAEATP